MLSLPYIGQLRTSEAKSTTAGVARPPSSRYLSSSSRGLSGVGALRPSFNSLSFQVMTLRSFRERVRFAVVFLTFLGLVLDLIALFLAPASSFASCILFCTAVGCLAVVFLVFLAAVAFFFT